jgi:hypothetical protein
MKSKALRLAECAAWLFFASSALLLTGCAEPKVRNSVLIQHPTSKIVHLYVDTSRTRSNGVADVWPSVERGGFERAVPAAFDRFGVQAKVFALSGEAKTTIWHDGDYLLAVSYANGFSGSTGTGATFNLDLIEPVHSRKVWAGSVFVSGSGTLLTQNLGEVVANNMARALDASHLFSTDVAADKDVNTTAKSPADAVQTTVLSAKQQEAFDKFKSMKSPKAFVIGDGGASFWAYGQSANEEPPSVRAMHNCESRRILNCRVISDGRRVF